MLHFKKMHGLGNDFVIIDARENGLVLSPEQMQALSNRKRGIGCDQFGFLRHSKNWQEMVFLDMYNAGGDPVEACGNMTRCVADILMIEEGMDNVVLETLNGSLNCWKEADGQIRIAMGVPKMEWQAIPLAEEVDTLHLPLKGDPVAVNIGNPHCVFFVDNIEDKWGDKAVNEMGAKFMSDPLFPQRTNVEFAEILSPTHIRMRVYERNVGITDACGSGACATAVAAIKRGLTERKMKMTLDGGDLTLNWPSDEEPIQMTGPVAYVYDGVIPQ